MMRKMGVVLLAVVGCGGGAPATGQRWSALVAQFATGSISTPACPCTDISAASAADGHVEVLARSASDGTLWRITEDGSTSQQLTTPGHWAKIGLFWEWVGPEAIERTPAVVLSHADGLLHVFYVRSSDYALVEEQGSGTGAWSNVVEIGHGGAFHDPAVLELGDGTLVLAATGSDLQAHVSVRSGGSWGAWQAAGALPSSHHLVAGPLRLVVSPRDGSVWLFARDENGDTWATSATAPGAPFAAWTELGGDLQWPAAVAADADGAINVIGVGSDGQLWLDLQNETDAGFGGWTPLVSGSIGGSGGANSTPVIGSYFDPQQGNASRRLELFFTNTGGSASGSFWSMAQCAPGTWTGMQTGVTQPSALAGAASSAVAAEADGRLTGFNLDANGYLLWASAARPVATLPNGELAGRYQCGVSVYKGVPYAQPPVGSLRWHPPVPVDNLSYRDAGFYHPRCVWSDGTGQEDCLYLNVFAPSNPPAGGAPVMVYMHGSNYGGAAASYDGAALANRAALLGTPVVVVTVDFRLGPFAMLAADEPTCASGLTLQTNGDLGLRDQIQALAFVHDDITYFGGDPNRVLVFGQSGGGASVEMLAASPATRGQFWAAAMQSGAGGDYPVPLAQAQAYDAPLITQLGCSGASDVPQCMLGASTSAVVAAAHTAGLWWMPLTIDGFVLDEDLPTSLAHNLSVPTIIGSTRDETANGQDNPDWPLSPDDYTSYVNGPYGFGQFQADGVTPNYLANPAKTFTSTTASEVLALFPAVDPDSTWQRIRLDTDAHFICSARHVARLAASTGQPVYRYLFTHTFQDPDALSSDGTDRLTTLGAFHAAELPFLFASPALFGGVTETNRPTPAEWTLSDQMVSYWTHFAASRDPNGGSTPAWQPYTAWSSSDDPLQQLDTPIQASTGYDIQQCDYLDQWY